MTNELKQYDDEETIIITRDDAVADGGNGL